MQHSSPRQFESRERLAFQSVYREVLTCRFLLGLSVRETAARMGFTEATVKTSQFRALKRAADLHSVVNHR